MRKNLLSYGLAFILLAIVFLFFGKAYRELIRYTELTNRHNAVHSYFQNLSKQVNNAAVINLDLLKINDSIEGLFFTDSASIHHQLGLLKSTAIDSVNIKIIGTLDTLIKAELPWLLSSNVPDSIVHHKAIEHIASLKVINTLINRGIERTQFLIAYRKEELAKSIMQTAIWAIIFGILSTALLVFTTINLFRQRLKTVSKEIELKKSENIFRQTLDNMIEGAQMHDFNWKYIYVNKALVKYSNYTEEELLGCTLMEKYPGIEQTALFTTLKQCMEERTAHHLETEFVFPNGSKKDFELSIQPVPEGIFILSIDITERKKAAAKLEQSIAEVLEYKFALDESSIVATTDQKGIIKHVNDNFCKISKYGREELIGQDHRIVNSSFHSPEFIRNLWTTIANGKIWKGELRNKAKDGSIYWVDTTIVPFLNDAGKPYQYLAIRSDITVRKEAEAKQVLFASIVNSSDDAIFSKTLDGIIMAWNRGAQKVFGYSYEEIMGKHISIIIPKHLLNEEKEIIEKIHKGETVDHYETERLRKDGKTIIVSISVSPIRDGDGKIIGASKISRDITIEKEATRKILKANRLYAFLSAINQSIVHIKDEETLLNTICTIATGVGQFKMAWVGLLDDVGNLCMVTLGGDTTTTRDLQKHSGQDFTQPQLKKTPTGQALSTGVYAVNNDVLNDPVMAPWKEEFLKHGIKANISLPLKKFGKVIGVLGLNSTTEHFFDEQEIALLQEGSSDISFAIENFEKEKQREQAEQRILQNEQRLNKAQSIAHIGHWELDFATGVAWWSEESCRIFGLDPADNQQTFEIWISFLHPDDKDRVMKLVQKQRETLAYNVMEHRIVRKDGSIRYIHSESMFEFDANGKPKGLYGISHDKTEERLADEKLLDSEAKLKEAQVLARIGNFEIDLVTNGLYWSDEMFRVLGYEPGEVEPSSELFLGKVHPDDAEATNNSFYSTFKTFEGGSSSFKLFSKDGSLKHLYCEWRFEFDSHQKPIRIYGIVQNVTELKSTQQELETTLHELEHRVEERTREVTEKNKSILDSITYAKQIQVGLLCRPSILSGIFPNSFILTLPRDIVNGDFFWAYQKRSKKFVVVADCTGHGVPAALMSIIGNNLLNQIIVGEHIENPSEILELLDIRLQETLKGEELELRDGMDLGLCIVDTHFNELYFAGALRPLFISDANGKISQFPGSKYSIGGGMQELHKKFETIRFPITPGQRIYLTSDGYVSQFGGPDKRKFMRARLMTTLEELHDQPIQQQGDRLLKVLFDWSGNLDQVDDIMVVGIEL